MGRVLRDSARGAQRSRQGLRLAPSSPAVSTIPGMSAAAARADRAPASSCPACRADCASIRATTIGHCAIRPSRLRRLKARSAREDHRRRLHRQRFRIQRRLLLPHHAPAQMDQHLGNIDLHRADLIARPAQRRRKRQRLRRAASVTAAVSQSRQSAPSSSTHTRARPSADTPGRYSGTRRSECSAAFAALPHPPEFPSARCRAAPRENAAARRPAVTPVHSEL